MIYRIHETPNRSHVIPAAIVILLSFVLTACGAAQPAPAVEPTFTSIPPTSTETPLPTQTATPWPAFTPTPQAEEGTLVVDAGVDLGEINPLVYGTNVGPWQDIGRTKLAYMVDAGYTILRYPGGNWGDENLLGEKSLDEFIAMCQTVGAVPMLQLKLTNTTAAEAADWVRYVNIEKGYNIRYWNIGNEPNLYWSKRDIEGYDTVTFNTQWREIALAMREVDPSIILIGPEINQYTSNPSDNPKDLHYKDWMDEFLRVNGDLVDVVSFHRYPFGSYDPSQAELLRSSEEWDRIIPYLRSQIHTLTGRDLPIAITEVNSNWSNRSRGENTPDSFANAIWWADCLGRIIKQKVDIVNQFAVAGTGGWSLLEGQLPRPSYYVQVLYHKFGSELLQSTSGIPLVSIYAARAEDGSLTLMIVNRSTSEVQAPLTVQNAQVSGTAARWLLDAEHQAEEMDPVSLGGDAQITLPPLSVTLLILSTQ